MQPESPYRNPEERPPIVIVYAGASAKWLAAWMIVALILVGVVIGHRVALHCEAAAHECRYDDSHLLWSASGSVALADIEGAVLEGTPKGTSRVMLRKTRAAGGGTFEITHEEESFGDDAKDAMVRDVDAFLGDPAARTLDAGYDTRTPALGATAPVIAGLLLLVAIVSPKVRLSVYKIDRKLVIEWTRAFVWKSTRVVDLASVGGALLGSRRGTTRVDLTIVDGTIIALRSWYSSFGGREKARVIAAFNAAIAPDEPR